MSIPTSKWTYKFNFADLQMPVPHAAPQNILGAAVRGRIGATTQGESRSMILTEELLIL